MTATRASTCSARATSNWRPVTVRWSRPVSRWPSRTGWSAWCILGSGLAARVGLSIVNSPGTIDAGYRGEIKVALINLDPEVPIVVHRGDRIAQLLVQRVELPELVEVTSFDEAGLGETSRGDGGHGSSGGHASL